MIWPERIFGRRSNGEKDAILKLGKIKTDIKGIKKVKS